MADGFESRRPAQFMDTVTDGAMEDDIKARRDLDRMHPDHLPFLGVGRVTNVNYEEFYVTLRIVLGSSEDFERVPIPMTHPGAGGRHFLGSMPEIGDYCTVGWMAQESSEGKWGTKTPVVLGWIIPGTWPGRDWLTTDAFPREEFDLSSPKNRTLVQGVFDRVRHKLRHMQPGNILASSSQGSDMVLDESVTLANRRGNEFILRDQDQAIVARSLQQFHAMAGSRIYAGQVQRDARFLSTTMLSDGKLWDGRQQSFDGLPVTESDLPDSPETEDFLTPARMLARKEVGAANGYLGRPGISLPERLDPYTFLQQGGFIDESGMAIDGKAMRSDAIYGGKPIFRVASQSRDNAAINADLPTLTEWRLEMTHTSTGRLPVTEQTDGFDADRLPRTDGDTNDPQGINPNSAYMEVVYGSVVGNDPYSEYGRQRYGMPLVGVVFDGSSAAPRLEPARIVEESTTGDTSTPIGKHLATLFRMVPRVSQGAPDTFWGVNKDGQLRASISGPQDENSVELAVRGGLKLAIGGKLDLDMASGLRLGSKTGDSDTNVGVQIDSERGAVRIYGGASKKGPQALSDRLGGTGGGEGDLPSVEIEAQTNALIKATKKVMVKGEQAEVNARTVNVKGHQEVTVQAADRIGIDTKALDTTVVGKSTSTFTGPKDLLPTNGAVDDKTYVTIPGLPAKSTLIVFGERTDEIWLGNDRKTIRIGNFLYTVNIGTISLTAGITNLSLTPATITGVAAGAVAFESTAGAAVISGSLNASLVAKAGPAVVRGTTGVFLSAPADFNIGPIITAGSLDPLTGLPFLTWFMGAKLHQVTP